MDALQLTLGLILWSGSTMGNTCNTGPCWRGRGWCPRHSDCGLTWMVSRWSLLSQMIRDSFTFLISASWSPVKEEGQPPFSYQNLVSSNTNL